MAKDEAYRIAEEKIEEARRSGAKKLDLSQRWDAADSEKLTELPESTRQLKHLESLDVSSNLLTALPEWLGELTQLQWLSLAYNQLTALPESVAHLARLQKLGPHAKSIDARAGGIEPAHENRVAEPLGNSTTENCA